MWIKRSAKSSVDLYLISVKQSIPKVAFAKYGGMCSPYSSIIITHPFLYSTHTSNNLIAE